MNTIILNYKMFLFTVNILPKNHNYVFRQWKQNTFYFINLKIQLNLFYTNATDQCYNSRISLFNLLKKRNRLVIIKLSLQPCPLNFRAQQLFTVRLSYSWINLNFNSRLITNQYRFFEKIFVLQFRLSLFLALNLKFTI